MERKYQAIYQSLLEGIEKGKFQPHSKLPSENELMKQYDASRDTIRKSLQQLLQNGYIQKAKGKGSIVLDYNKIAFPVSGVTSFKELAKTMKGSIKTTVRQCYKMPIDAELGKALYMDQGEVWKVERLRIIDGEKIILDRDFFNASIVANITKEIAENSLYEYIEQDLGLKIGFARKEITLVKASEEDKEVLDLKEFDMLALVCSYTYLEDATLFQYTESRHRPDKFRFVDFARRQQQ